MRAPAGGRDDFGRPERRGPLESLTDGIRGPERFTPPQRFRGVGAIDRRTMCRLSAGAMLALATRTRAQAAAESLGERARRSGLLYGTALWPDEYSKVPAYGEVVRRECSILTAALYMSGSQPTRGRYDFSGADEIVAFARARGMAVRGHPLIWHEELPSWFSSVNEREARQVLTNHVRTVVARYAGRMHSWDVVNEVIAPEDKRADGQRISRWFQIAGPDYIDLAFRTARAADAGVQLTLNEAGLEQDDDESESRRQAALRLLRTLLKRGVPVTALGLQAHITADPEGGFKTRPLRKFLREVAGLGLKIFITELDVIDKELPADIRQRDAMVARTYRDFLDAVLAEPAVKVIVHWGLSDKFSWLTDWADSKRADGLPVRGLPFDAEMRSTPAYDAIAGALDRAPRR